jgi:hypothetical protein
MLDAGVEFSVQARNTYIAHAFKVKMYYCKRSNPQLGAVKLEPDRVRVAPHSPIQAMLTLRGAFANAPTLSVVSRTFLFSDDKDLMQIVKYPPPARLNWPMLM